MQPFEQDENPRMNLVRGAFHRISYSRVEKSTVPPPTPLDYLISTVCWAMGIWFVFTLFMWTISTFGSV
jgi:hypothetical protein